jgi:hypothetical protein
MSALSPDDPVFLSGLVTSICFEQEDQRQAPVAAEKQRSATHRQAYPDAGVRSDRMRQLSAGQFPALIVLMTTVTSMKRVFNVTVATRRRFYARDRKENGTIFGGTRQLAEPTLPPPIPIMTPLHKRCATSARSAREKSLRMGGFPESLNSSVIAVQNDFLFNQPCPSLLKFSHDPAGQSRLGRSLG